MEKSWLRLLHQPTRETRIKVHPGRLSRPSALSRFRPICKLKHLTTLNFIAGSIESIILWTDKRQFWLTASRKRRKRLLDYKGGAKDSVFNSPSMENKEQGKQISGSESLAILPLLRHPLALYPIIHPHRKNNFIPQRNTPHVDLLQWRLARTSRVSYHINAMEYEAAFCFHCCSVRLRRGEWRGYFANVAR
jgi:hypothetical protein